MFSKILGSCSKSEFLRLINAVSQDYETDVLFSGDGYDGEDLSVCACLPVSHFTVTLETRKEDLKRYIFQDDSPAIGYLAYDFGFSKVGEETLGLFKKYTGFLYHQSGLLRAEALNEDFIDHLQYYKPTDFLAEFKPFNLTQRTSKEEYIRKTADVIEYIRSGECYQLNLSIEYEGAFEGDDLCLWLHMAENCPAPFMSYFKTDGNILSVSPERFLRVQGRRVLSQPIKGTLRLNDQLANPESALTSSAKESSELSMIVDMVRNDISSSCKVGSVTVERHKDIMRVGNLLQMYSSVCGVLDEERDVIDLIFDAFPGASITGCPKRRAMELIDKLEPHRRGVYCGSMFFIKDRDNMDSSIMIRTAFCKDGRLKFYAGSGIVAASEPAMEYNETVSKAENFMRYFSDNLL